MREPSRKPLLNSPLPRYEPCRECGTLLVDGEGLIEPDPDEDYEHGSGPVLIDGYEVAVFEWCPNLDCPSNHARPNLAQLGPDLYRCTVCGAELIDVQVESHRAQH